MTEFQHNISDYVVRLRENKKPLVVTVNGHAELIVQDAEAYQLILERLELAETVAGIRRGLKDVEDGKFIPLEDAVKALRAKHGF